MAYCENCKHQYEEDICEGCFIAEKNGFAASNFEPKTADPVNHPSHYETGKFECIEVMKEIYGVEAVQNFCLLNAFKYLYRCENKNNKAEDIKKANWYLEKFKELESVKNGKS